MDKIFDEFLAYKHTVKQTLLIVLFVLFGIFLYIYFTSFYVLVRFDELGPVVKNMSVYYNGFRIGKITNIRPDNDYKHTLVKVALTDKDLKLPQNTTVHVERFPNGELYLQFVYPNSPSFATIVRGDILEGIAPYSLGEFMLGQSVSGVTDVVSLHIIKALNAADAANKELEVFFKVTSRVVDENRIGINQSVNNTVAMTKSLAEMAENLNQASKKINNAIDEKSIKETTLNIAKGTKDIDKTMKKVDETVTQANATAANLNAISSGLKSSLSKRFGGARILFGTSVKD